MKIRTIKILNPRRGMGVLELLIAVVIIMVLTSMYFGRDKKTIKDQVVEYQTSVERTQSVACSVNRNTLRASIQEFQMQSPGVPVTTDTLTAARVRIPNCPDGGVISFDTAGNAECSLHP